MNVMSNGVENARRELYRRQAIVRALAPPILQDVQTRAAVTLLFGHDRRSRRRRSTTGRTRPIMDPSTTRAIAWVYFGVRGSSRLPPATDTSGRVAAAFFGDAADTIIEALRAIDGAID